MRFIEDTGGHTRDAFPSGPYCGRVGTISKYKENQGSNGEIARNDSGIKEGPENSETCLTCSHVHFDAPNQETEEAIRLLLS